MRNKLSTSDTPRDTHTQQRTSYKFDSSLRGFVLVENSFLPSCFILETCVNKSRFAHWTVLNRVFIEHFKCLSTSNTILLYAQFALEARKPFLFILRMLVKHELILKAMSLFFFRSKFNNLKFYHGVNRNTKEFDFRMLIFTLFWLNHHSLFMSSSTFLKIFQFIFTLTVSAPNFRLNTSHHCLMIFLIFRLVHCISFNCSSKWQQRRLFWCANFFEFWIFCESLSQVARKLIDSTLNKIITFRVILSD